MSFDKDVGEVGEYEVEEELALLVDAGCIAEITASCGTDVGDVGVAGLEEIVDRPGTTKGTSFAVLQLIFLPFLMKCGPDHWSHGNCARDPRRAFRVKELRVYLREVSLSRISPIP